VTAAIPSGRLVAARACVLEPRLRVAQLAPEALDELGRGFAVFRKLLVAHLAEEGR
jgi:hypothetical protein